MELSENSIRLALLLCVTLAVGCRSEVEKIRDAKTDFHLQTWEISRAAKKPSFDETYAGKVVSASGPVDRTAKDTIYFTPQDGPGAVCFLLEGQNKSIDGVTRGDIVRVKATKVVNVPAEEAVFFMNCVFETNLGRMETWGRE